MRAMEETMRQEKYQSAQTLQQENSGMSRSFQNRTFL
jgi:hypothetical protein